MGEVCRRVEVGIVIRPTQYYASIGVPMLRSANVRESGIDLTGLGVHVEADHAMMSKSAVTPGDLVTVRTGYPGTTAVVPDGLATANCVDIIISRPGPRIQPHFLAIWINSDQGKDQVLRGQGGLAQQHYNVSQLKKLLVPVPSLREQQRISSIVALAGERVRYESALAEKLRGIRLAITTTSLRGESGGRSLIGGDAA